MRRTPVVYEVYVETKVGILLHVVPTTLKEAQRWVNQVHRHHPAPVGGLFAIAAAEGETVIGVVIVGRPVSRHLDDAWTVEVTRLAVAEGHPNACSMLYGAAWRAARAMGYQRAITYTLASENGTSVKAAGWKEIGSTPGRSWNVPSRPRADRHPIGPKTLWEVA